MRIWNVFVKHHKKALIGLGIVLIILGALHLFITQKSALILEKIVSQASKGKYVLHSASVEFSYWPPNIHATYIRIEPQKDSFPENYYQLSVDTLHIKIKSLWELIFRKSVTIENISLESPSIVIKANPDPANKEKREFNLHGNLLLMQKELNKMISMLRMETFRIDNAKLKILTDSHQYFLLDRIFLHIDDLQTNLEANAKSGNLDLHAAIHLWIDKPNFVWPDSNLLVSLDNLDWNTRNHLISLENIGFGWIRHREKTDSVHAELHSVLLKNLDWSEWINSGKMNIDSVMASSGYFSITLLNKAAPKDTTKITRNFASMISPLSIGHFIVREIQSEATLRGEKQPVNISVTGDSLKTQDLSVDINRKNPFTVSSLELSIREFKGKDESENWHSSFSSFHILKDHIAIKDYDFRIRDNMNSTAGSSLSVPRLDMSGLSIPSLLEGKLVVNDLFMDRPFFLVSSQPGDKNRKAHGKIEYKPLAVHFPFLNIKTIHLKNGQFKKINAEDGKVNIASNGIFGLIYANKLLEAKSFLEFPAAFGKLGMDEFEFNSPGGKIELRDIQVQPADHRLTLNKGKYSLASENGSFAFAHLSLSLDSIYSLIQEKKSIHIRKLRVDSGTISLDLPSEKTPEKKIKSTEKSFPVLINEVSFYNIILNLTRGTDSLSSRIKSLSVLNLRNTEEQWEWDKAEGLLDQTKARGRNWEFSSPGISLNYGGFSSISDLTFKFIEADKKFTLSMPSLLWQWPVHQLAFDSISIPKLQIHKPEIEFEQAMNSVSMIHPESPQKIGRQFYLRMDSFDIDQAHVLFMRKTDSSFLRGSTTFQKLLLTNASIRKSSNRPTDLWIEDVAAKVGRTSIQIDSNLSIGTTGVQILASGFNNRSSGEPMNAEFRQLRVDSVYAEHVNQNKKVFFESEAIGISEKLRLYFHKDSLRKWKYEIPPLWINKTNLVLDHPDNKIIIENISVDLKARRLSVDSFRIENKISRDSFFANQAYQKDYMTVRSGRIELEDFDIPKKQKDTGLFIKNLHVRDLFLMAERDKLRPEDTFSIKPMFVGLVKKVPFPLFIDTIALERATIWHNVIAKKTAEQGTIFFSDVSGWLANIKNYNFVADDTLRIRVNAKIMGKGSLNMRFRESYLDSLQGFYLSAGMGKFDMPELNRILVPLILIKITKGQIDTMWLDAHANTILAFGLMQIDYRKLHVEKLDLKQKKQGFISWLANIIVRTNNEKDGTIYVERHPGKSIFNYWGRISLSGLLTNIRVASNKKYRKKYEEALIKYKLPPHLLDED